LGGAPNGRGDGRVGEKERGRMGEWRLGEGVGGEEGGNKSR